MVGGGWCCVVVGAWVVCGWRSVVVGLLAVRGGAWSWVVVGGNGGNGGDGGEGWWVGWLVGWWW